jgi:hypothetical protein
MSQQRGKYKYSLQPLLTKFGWEVDTLNLELQRLGLLQRREEARVADIELSVHDAEQRLRAMQAGEIIDVERKRQVGLYLKQQYEALRERRSELTRLNSLREQVVQQMSNKKKNVKALERHRDRKQTESISNEHRMQLKEADAAWLMRASRKRVL